MTMITMVMMMMPTNVPTMVAMMMSILWMMTPTSSNNAQVKNSKDGEDDFYTKQLGAAAKPSTLIMRVGWEIYDGDDGNNGGNGDNGGDGDYGDDNDDNDDGDGSDNR